VKVDKIQVGGAKEQFRKLHQFQGNEAFDV